MKKNIYIFLFSLLISLIIIEFILRFFFPQNVSAPWKIYLDDGLLLNKKNGSAKHYFHEKEIEYFFGDYHNRKYKLNNSGEKVLVLGDSFTFGWLIKDEDTFVYKLADRFKEYEFINAGVGGHGTSDHLSYFEKFCKKINPKYTFIFVSTSDIERSRRSNLYYINEKTILKNGKNKIPTIALLTDNNPVYEFLVTKLHTMAFLRKVYSHYANNDWSITIAKPIKKDSYKKNSKFILEKKLLEKFKKLSLECNTSIYFINLAWDDRETTDTLTYDFFNNNSNFLKSNEIDYIDLYEYTSSLRKNRDEYVIKYDGHPNEKANDIYFNIIYNKLIKILKN